MKQRIPLKHQTCTAFLLGCSMLCSPFAAHSEPLPAADLLYSTGDAPLYPAYEHAQEQAVPKALPKPAAASAALPTAASLPPAPQPVQPVTAATWQPIASQAEPEAAKAPVKHVAIAQPTPDTAPPAETILAAATSAPPLPAPPPESEVEFTPLATLEAARMTPPSEPEEVRWQPLPEEEASSVDIIEPLPEQDFTMPLPAPEAAIEAPHKPEPENVMPAERDLLDEQTMAILSRIPGGIDSARRMHGKTTLKRIAPDVKGVLDARDDEEVARHESMGVAIKVRRPRMDVTIELQNAYEALMGGQPQVALQIYKDILEQIPTHQDALFGVATTYHRTGEPERARPFYVKLLNLYPNHRDGLINFLSLIAEQAPEEAMGRLEYLADQNPDFSAIPALLGVIYSKNGDPKSAIDAMIRAVRMEPENLAYKYNLAVLYDENAMPEDALVLYNQLLAAGRSGLPLPAPMRDLQERAIAIASQRGSS